MNPSIQIDRNSPVPIFRQLEEQILKHIQNGDLKPGDRIPSQYELAREFQVSRTTIQKAIDHLILEQLLYFKQGKGIYVAAPPMRQHLPILQSLSQSLVELGYRVHADLLLKEEVEAPTRISQRLNLPASTSMLHIKRLVYADNVPMVLQETFIEGKRFRGILELDLRNRSMTELIEEVGNTHIEDSSFVVGASQADWGEARMLHILAGTPLLTMEETGFEENKQPVRYSENKLRSDYFRVVIGAASVDNRVCLEYRLQERSVNISLV